MLQSPYQRNAEEVDSAVSGMVPSQLITMNLFAQLDDKRAASRQQAMTERLDLALENVRKSVSVVTDYLASCAKEEIADMSHSARLSLGQKHRRRMERARA